jgi:hypothetical protein
MTMPAFAFRAATAGIAAALAFGILGLAQQADNSDPVIEAARAAASTFAQSLPDYIVKRTTTRYQGLRANRLTHEANVKTWRRVDNVSADVTYQQGDESYSHIEVDGKPANHLPTEGAWAVNEFASALLGTLAQTSHARFTNQRPDTIMNRAAYHYDFAIDRSYSTWYLEAERARTSDAVRYTPAYSGEIWFDRETKQVLRIIRLARDIPDDFPLDSVESINDFDSILIGDKKYMMPTRSESYICERDNRACFRNENVFGNYRKFGADTSITFEDSAK